MADTRLKTFEALKGETIVAVDWCVEGSDAITFTLATGEKYSLYHRQDCCESVSVQDVVGDVADLIGEVVLAEEESNADGEKPSEYADSYTWTFYRLGTVKGTVVLRWLGESNGYYSESVTWSGEYDY